MNCSVSVTIAKNNDIVFNKKTTAKDMKDANYQQPQLKTDIEPLEKYKENDLFYLAAAVEKMKEDVGAYLTEQIPKHEEDHMESKSKKAKIQK